MSRRQKYYLAFLAAATIYIAGTLLGPLGPNRFNLTPVKTHLIQMSFALPVIFIWAAAVFGAENLKHYAHSIKKYDDGKAMDTLATGLLLLAASSIIGGVYGIMRA